MLSNWFHIFRCAALLLLPGMLVLSHAVAADTDDMGRLFSLQPGQAALTGIFYDLKQTQHHIPTDIVDRGLYANIVDNFIFHGLDDLALCNAEHKSNDIFRASKPIYTSYVYIPQVQATSAPAMFGVDRVVKPTDWMVHYKGVVVPPSDGTYRFVGYGDDLLAVFINGKLVMNGSRGDTTGNMPHIKDWKPSDPSGPIADGIPMTMGDWLPLKATVPVDIDIIFGDRPGGIYAAYVMVQKQGANYEMVNGYPVLPAFSVGPYDADQLSMHGTRTKVAPAQPWTCIQ
jgi:hypothetical protein